MQITINISDAVASEARANGLKTEDYVEGLIAERKLSAPQVVKTEENRAERMVKLEKFFEDISAYSEKIPLLPDEALTRESFYSNHDEWR